MVQASLPTLLWPQATKSFLKAETTVRRAVGVEAPAVKPPFMPRLAIALDTWLQGSVGLSGRDI